MTDILQQFRAFTSTMFQQLKPFAQTFEVRFPGADWEPFLHCNGAPTYWRSTTVPVGRAVMFKSDGEACMAPHYHDSAEIVVVTRGEVGLMVEGRRVLLTKNKSFRVEPHIIHSAHYTGPAEALVWWPEHNSDTLDIGVLRD